MATYSCAAPPCVWRRRRGVPRRADAHPYRLEMSARGENGRKLLFLATLRRWTAPGGRWAHGQWFSTTTQHKRSEREGVNPLKLGILLTNANTNTTTTHLCTRVHTTPTSLSSSSLSSSLSSSSSSPSSSLSYSESCSVVGTSSDVLMPNSSRR